MQASKIIIGAVVGAGLLAGCKTKSPPTVGEIHQQSGTLTNLVLTNAWKAAPVSTNAIQDNWLTSFGDV